MGGEPRSIGSGSPSVGDWEAFTSKPGYASKEGLGQARVVYDSDSGSLVTNTSTGIKRFWEKVMGDRSATNRSKVNTALEKTMMKSKDRGGWGLTAETTNKLMRELRQGHQALHGEESYKWEEIHQVVAKATEESNKSALEKALDKGMSTVSRAWNKFAATVSGLFD